jgi:hypothetical protein
MERITAVGAILMLGLVCSAAASAQTIVSAENPKEIASIIQRLGFQAKLETDNLGDPVIRSSATGVDFSIYFYDCTNNKRCKSLHLTADRLDGRLSHHGFFGKVDEQRDD